MYQTMFGFQARPFSATPRHDWFFGTTGATQTYDTLASCIERAAGTAMLIGGPGTGKSLICRMLVERMSSNFHVVLLDSARLCTRRAFLQSILFELGLPFRDLEEGELRLTLMDFLKPSEKCPNGMLIVVDEAQVLPLRLLEELHMITNLVRDGQPRVRLVLSGNQSLEETFTNPQLASFSQRVAARCYLKALNRSETADYIGFQLEKAGGEAARSIFSEDTCRTVYEMTEGLPRLINQVCDQALLLASASAKTTVEPATVAEAWSDIQQLPTPWFVGSDGAGSSADSESGKPVNVIEFGELDEFEPATTSAAVDVDDGLPVIDEGTDVTSCETTRDDSTPMDEPREMDEPGEMDEPRGLDDDIEVAVQQNQPEIENSVEFPVTANEQAKSGSTEQIEFGSLEGSVFDTDAPQPLVDHSTPAETASSQKINLQSNDLDMNRNTRKTVVELQPEFAFEQPSNPFTERFDVVEPVEDPFVANAEIPATPTDGAKYSAPSSNIDDKQDVAVEVVTNPRVRPVRLQSQGTKNVAEQTSTVAKSPSIANVTPSVAMDASETLPASVAMTAKPAGSVEKPRIRITPASSADDRDIIVMTETPSQVIELQMKQPTNEPPKARREEYQSLFQKLKNG